MFLTQLLLQLRVLNFLSSVLIPLAFIFRTDFVSILVFNAKWEIIHMFGLQTSTPGSLLSLSPLAHCPCARASGCCQPPACPQQLSLPQGQCWSKVTLVMCQHNSSGGG